MKARLKPFAAVLLCGGFALISGTSFSSEQTVLFEGSWTKKNYSISGRWQIVEENGKRFVLLDDDFKTTRAPDLKIFLSPLSLNDISDRNATRESVLISELHRYKGAQRFEIPQEVELDTYKTIVIHCEKYSKIWGGSLLAPKK